MMILSDSMNIKVADLRQYNARLPHFSVGGPHHAFSVNGLDWTVNSDSSALPHEGSILPRIDKPPLKLTRRERPHVLVDADDKLLGLFNAAALGNTHSPYDDRTLVVAQPFT